MESVLSRVLIWLWLQLMNRQQIPILLLTQALYLRVRGQSIARVQHRARVKVPVIVRSRVMLCREVNRLMKITAMSQLKNQLVMI